MKFPARLVIIDIDGLRQDVWQQALAGSQLPHLGRLVGGARAACGMHVLALSCAPSITFAAQASIFTGAFPDQHGIAGNQYFDRFGRVNGSRPRFYAFDIGDTLAVQDAVAVFTGDTGLLDKAMLPEFPTLYELASARGLISTVIYHMIGRGATTWVKPSLADIARFTKGGGLLGISAEIYDSEMMAQAVDYLHHAGRPDLLTVYFMGLDHQSHVNGPAVQLDYLTRVIDPLIGKLVGELDAQGLLDGTLFVVVSDHGQIGVVPDDRHALRVGVPFDREMAGLFDALGLDVHDKPGEGSDCDAIVACNGGMAHVYLRRPGGSWSLPPRFTEDVLRVAGAFDAGNRTGINAPDLQGALALILVRDAASEGWQANFRVFQAGSDSLPLEVGLAASGLPEIDAINRLRRLAGPTSGDLLLVSDYTRGFYFGAPLRGVHGGLHPEDSSAVLSLGWPGISAPERHAFRRTVRQVLRSRCQEDGNRQPSVADLLPVLVKVLGW